jgi:phosphatidate cytidylyltransferase
MLSRRLVSAFILIPVITLLVFLGSWPLLMALAIVGLLAGYEYLDLLRGLGTSPCRPVSLLLLLLSIADSFWIQWDILPWALWPFMAILLAEQVFHRNRPGSVHSWAGALAGALYIGLGLGFFLRMRALDQGDFRVMIVLVATWISDSGAYFVGVSRGKRRLAPEISPNKTWEGVWGGLIAGVPAVWLPSWLLLGLPHWQGIVLGIVLVVAATLGDLAESVIKRQVGVKDSSGLIPGHGGMLDRIDSLLFVGPAVYYVMVVFYYL